MKFENDIKITLHYKNRTNLLQYSRLVLYYFLYSIISSILQFKTLQNIFKYSTFIKATVPLHNCKSYHILY